MKKLTKSLLIALSLLLTLAACTQAASSNTPNPPAQSTAAPTTPAQAPAAATATPPSVAPATKPAPSTDITPAYPAPGTLPTGEAVMLTPFLESAAIDMNTPASGPAQPVLKVSGDLPTGCYSLQYKVAKPDAKNQVNVSLAIVPPDPGVNCTQMVTTVTKEIPLSDLTAGQYTILVNGQKVGTLQVP